MKAQKLWRSSLTIAALIPATLVSACSGDKPSSSGDPNVDPPTRIEESAGIMMMRRLTYREYAHMVAELLGTTKDTTSGWSPDVTGDIGFVAPTDVADLQVELLNETADTIVEDALKAGKLFPAGKLAKACESPASAAESGCATQFITGFGLRAYRRPVEAAEQTDLMKLFTTVRGLGLDYSESVAAMAKAMIQSPNFLYHWEIGPTKPVVGADGLVPLTQWQTASRLAMALWESMPDDELLQAAADGQLSTADDVTAQTTRMLADPRATEALLSFHQQWLLNTGIRIGDVTSIAKSSPLWTPAAAQGVETEFSQFLTSVYTGDGTLESLFTAPYSFVNHDLATIYGVEGPPTGFAKVMLDPTQRAGIFTQTAFLASQATDVLDNPIYRGLTVYIKVLCGTVGSPPANVPPVNFIAKGTTRQSFDAHGSNKCAEGCHTRFDPPGFAFENYDGIGAYRTMDNGLAVDSTGTLKTPGGATITFKNAVDLAQQLAQNSEAQACIGRQWARYTLGRMESPDEAGSLALAAANADKTPGYSVRDLVTTLLSSKAFMYRKPSPGEPL